MVLVPAFAGLATTESAEGSFPVHLEALCAELIPADQPVCFVEPITIADNQIGVQCFLRCCDHDYGLSVCTG